MTDQFDALLKDPVLATDVNVQEVLVRCLVEAGMMNHGALPSMMQRAAKALGVPPARLEGICRLDDTIDRRQALKVKARRRQEAPRLPEERIYPETGWLGGYLKWAEHMEVPLAWHFWAGLSILAACARRNFYTHSGAYPIWPSLYTVLVGPSGEGKSLCLQSAAKPMVESVNRKLQASRDQDANLDDTINLVPDRVTVATFLDKASISYTVGAEKVTDDDGKTRRVKAVKYRRKDSATMIIKDELCAFIGKDSIDSGAWIELLLDLSNGNATYTNPTQAKTRTLEGVSVTCLFGSAEENLRKGMPPTFLQGGMMGRCMWVHRLTSGRVYPTIYPLDPLMRDDLADWLVALTRQPNREIQRSPETDTWWGQWYHNWADAKEMQPEFRSWHNRMKDQLLRVAMLLALSNGRFEIKLVDLETSREILEAERNRFAELFGVLSLTREGETVDVVLQCIPTAPSWVTERVLAAKLQHRLASVRHLQDALEMLVKSGAIRGEKRTSTTGKAAPVVVMGYQRVNQRRRP